MNPGEMTKAIEKAFEIQLNALDVNYRQQRENMMFEHAQILGRMIEIETKNEILNDIEEARYEENAKYSH